MRNKSTTELIKVNQLPKVVAVGHPALAEEQVNEAGGTHPGVGVREGDHGVDERQHEHLGHRILADARAFPQAGPPDVGADKKCPNQALPNITKKMAKI